MLARTLLLLLVLALLGGLLALALLGYAVVAWWGVIGLLVAARILREQIAQGVRWLTGAQSAD